MKTQEVMEVTRDLLAGTIYDAEANEVYQATGKQVSALAALDMVQS